MGVFVVVVFVVVVFKNLQTQSQQYLYNIWDISLQNISDKSPQKVWDITIGK